MYKGYCSNLRYINNRLRDEYINVGVLIYDPYTNELSYEINRKRSLNKAEFFYPNSNLELINELFDVFEQIVGEINSSELTFDETVDRLNNFFKFSLRLSAFKVFMIEDIKDDLNTLYCHSVGSEEESNEWEKFSALK